MKVEIFPIELSFDSHQFVLVPTDSALSPLQSHIISACGKKVKDSTQRFATEHKELHSCVSKIGKAIDRVIFLVNL